MYLSQTLLRARSLDRYSFDSPEHKQKSKERPVQDSPYQESGNNQELKSVSTERLMCSTPLSLDLQIEALGSDCFTKASQKPNFMSPASEAEADKEAQIPEAGVSKVVAQAHKLSISE